jgi:response regulator RpfG family c-di-GMP phosphodiesterase
MLVDDNPDDNFFHEREIKKSNSEIVVIKKNTAMAALVYLKENKDVAFKLPDLILLDINMPGMNGWEFLKEYNLLAKELQSKVVIIMLTTSENSDDIRNAKSENYVSDFITKPMTKDVMNKITKKYFKT